MKHHPEAGPKSRYGPWQSEKNPQGALEIPNLERTHHLNNVVNLHFRRKKVEKKSPKYSTYRKKNPAEIIIITASKPVIPGISLSSKTRSGKSCCLTLEFRLRNDRGKGNQKTTRKTMTDASRVQKSNDQTPEFQMAIHVYMYLKLYIIYKFHTSQRVGVLLKTLKGHNYRISKTIKNIA